MAAITGALLLGGAVVVTAGPDGGSNPREVPILAADRGGGGLPGAMDALRITALGRAMAELFELPAAGELGGPRKGLTAAQLIDFADGRVAFRRVFTEKEGLGPGFNERSCGACHGAPTIGGGGKDMGFGVFTMAPAEDPKDTIATQKYGVPGFTPPKAPDGSPRRRTPPLYGIGLLDAVPDAVLKGLADPDDRDKDGVRGLLNERGHPAGGVRPARFGHKSNEPNLLRFVGGALRGEMGITNRASRAQSTDRDKLADPEAPADYVARVDFFVRNLAPPGRGPIDAAAKAGEKVFTKLGCPSCHKAELGDVKGAYTDLLIHDMGEQDGDGLYDGKAGPTSWRTPALWGLRHKQRLLHDERAGSPAEALAFHGGEAEKAAEAYRALPAARKAELSAFLGSL